MDNMDEKNSSRNNFHNNSYENIDVKLSQIENNTRTLVTPVAHGNNVTISDQQLTSNNSFAISLDHNNHRQYHDVSNNISHHHNYQQSICYNNVSPPQSYPQHNQNLQNLPQSNIFLSLNSLNITINSPQVNIIIISPNKPDNHIRLESFYN
ncbi:hypothetical protein RclHR1_00110008 [Rhizophagus clarus]|uniref:Uncharacterized protein n=1 Tax=Rhizophagus clarus TaxID=94130 RepID=A0A2Z6Q4K7_9GLOM|nr:hypothetical protein RclHR1_00110008 [Rhizophagus clarus]GES98018.1 hypothetical protein GLOIN_2v1522696 [Rhizophagus clarus]